MKPFTTQLRVRYGETDQMGYVYYGNYAQYFEVGRVELMRSLGLSYKVLEEKGIMLPVVDFSIQYKNPAYYDDLLTIETIISELPTATFKFQYKTFNQNQLLLNTASTTLVFVDKKTGKPRRAPDELLAKIRELMEVT